MTATFNLNDILFVLGSFTCVSVPLIGGALLWSRYRIVRRSDVSHSADHRHYTDAGTRPVVVKDGRHAGD